MITVVLPAYNEAQSLPPLLTKLRNVMEGLAVPYRVLVVDDGSSDGTADVVHEFAAAMPVKVVPHATNMGLHQALRTGLRTAVLGADPDDVVITLDADNTHDPGHIPAMLKRLSEGYDVVVASRYRPGAAQIGLSLDRRILSRTVNVLLAAFFAVPGVRDYSCGFRAYRAGVLQRAWALLGDRLIEATTFAAMAEILLKLHALGIRASEVPLVLRYDLKGGRSKMQVARTVRSYAGVVWRCWRLRHSFWARAQRRQRTAKRPGSGSAFRGAAK